MKVDLSTDELRTYLYNRDNGDGAAEKAIEKEFQTK
jgi:sarcosine oxidase delta subunit